MAEKLKEIIEESPLFEEWLEQEIPSQYREKSKILNNLNVLQLLSSDELGIVGFDGQEYPLPTLEVVQDAIRGNREFFETKLKQGFSELEIVPFALPLSRLIEILKEQLRKHHRENKLFRTKRGDATSLTPFDLNEDEPVSLWEEKDREADVNGSLIYSPEELSKDHKGKTKREILQSFRSSPFSGYTLVLREKDLVIPGITRCGKENIKKAQIIEGRKELEAGKSCREYLQRLQTNPMYQGESGQIPEEWITTFLVNLEKTDEVMDDSFGYGSAAFILGAYFPDLNLIPHGTSSFLHRKIYLGSHSEKIALSNFGIHPVVRINKI